jgi:hypothetical protein
MTKRTSGAAPAAPAVRDWHAAAIRRLESTVAAAVDRIRSTADQIEREAKHNITSANKDERALEFQTYSRVAEQVVHEVQTLIFNIGFSSIIDAAADAEAARTERLAAPAPESLGDIMTARLNGANLALAAMARAAQGWAEGSAENEVSMGHRDRKPADEQPFVVADILNMINDAAREVGVAPEYGTVK